MQQEHFWASAAELATLQALHNSQTSSSADWRQTKTATHTRSLISRVSCHGSSTFWRCLVAVLRWGKTWAPFVRTGARLARGGTFWLLWQQEPWSVFLLDSLCLVAQFWGQTNANSTFYWTYSCCAELFKKRWSGTTCSQLYLDYLRGDSSSLITEWWFGHSQV